MMRSAMQCAPKRCKCGRKLAHPNHGAPWAGVQYVYPSRAPIREACWYIACECGLRYIWGWHETSNGCWKIRSDMPLFDSKEVVAIA